MLWRHTASGVIHSEFWLRITSYLFAAIWYLLYAAYAFIGFGLWKLKNWARKAVLAILVFGLVTSFLLPRLFGNAGAMSIIGSVLFFVWMLWYLLRPRVRFAFGAWPSTRDGDATAEPPPGLSKIGKAWVTAGLIASFGLWAGFLMIAVESMSRSSEIYQLTLMEAQNSPCIAARLGVPLIQDGDLEAVGRKTVQMVLQA